MQVKRIDTLEDFDRLRPRWEHLYARDPDAPFFASWPWLRGWLQTSPMKWFVLAAEPDAGADYVAFLPLAELEHRDSGLAPVRELHIGGNRLADYTGFVCAPESAEEALAAFAAHVRDRISWDSFHMMDLMDPRHPCFLEAFSGGGFGVEEVEKLPCPCIRLPSDWDQYLAGGLSKKQRQNLRRAMRRIEGLDRFRVTRAEPDTVESHVESVLSLWQARWGARDERLLAMYRSTFLRCFESGNLYLSLFHTGSDLVGARLGFIDRPKSVFLGYMNCFDNRFAGLSPGTAMVGFSLRDAIGLGLRVYDFLRGGEAYKAFFGTEDRFNTSYVITRKGVGQSIRRLGRVLRPF